MLRTLLIIAILSPSMLLAQTTHHLGIGISYSDLSLGERYVSQTSPAAISALSSGNINFRLQYGIDFLLSPKTKHQEKLAYTLRTGLGVKNERSLFKDVQGAYYDFSQSILQLPIVLTATNFNLTSGKSISIGVGPYFNTALFSRMRLVDGQGMFDEINAFQFGKQLKSGWLLELSYNFYDTNDKLNQLLFRYETDIPRLSAGSANGSPPLLPAFYHIAIIYCYQL